MMTCYCQLRQSFQFFNKLFLLNALLAVSGTKMKCIWSAGFLVAPHKLGVGWEEEKEMKGGRKKKMKVSGFCKGELSRWLPVAWNLHAAKSHQVESLMKFWISKRSSYLKPWSPAKCGSPKPQWVFPAQITFPFPHVLVMLLFPKKMVSLICKTKCTVTLLP